MKQRGQSAIEFVILVGAVLFFFIAFLFAVNQNIADKTRENINLVLKEIALTVLDEINLAADSSEGYYREFEIPEKVINLDYDVNVTEGTIYARTVDGKYAISFPVTNVSGDLQKGLNVVRKEEGIICINLTFDECLVFTSPPPLSLAYFYQNENEMLDEMQELVADIYCQGCTPNGLTEFLDNLNNYGIVLLEDPNLNPAQIDQLESYVLSGGILLFSQNIGGGDDAFGLAQQAEEGENNITVINLDSYLVLSIGANYPLKQRPYVEAPLGFSPSVTNYVELAEYNGGEGAIARWNYGSGIVYFFGDFEVISGENFQEEAKDAIEAIMNDVEE